MSYSFSLLNALICVFLENAIVRHALTCSLNGISLEVVKAEKDLGILISSNTTWKDHIVMVVAKANKMPGFVKRNCAGLVNREALLRLYHSLVRSHVCFCSQVWAPQSAMNNLFLVKGIQRRASRFIVGKGMQRSVI